MTHDGMPRRFTPPDAKDDSEWIIATFSSRVIALTSESIFVSTLDAVVSCSDDVHEQHTTTQANRNTLLKELIIQSV
jgi:hypothetical protein